MRAATASADIAIIGGGIIGLATAERLVAHGASVIVVDEQGATGGATAASGGLVRAFDPTGTHTAWTAEGFAVYQRGGLRGAWPALHADGSLTLIGKQDLPHARSAAAALRTAGHEADILSADEITGKFPDLTIPGHLAGVFEPYAGWLPAAQVAQAILHDAGHALNLRTARATRLLHDSSGIRGVETTTGTVHTRAALLAAGVGSEALAASAGVHLPLRTRSVSYCLFRPEPAGGIGDLPTLVDRTTGAWLRRWGTDGTVLAGVASPRTDVPPTVTAGVPTEEEHRIRAALRQRHPALADARAVGGITAHDSMLVDGPGTVKTFPHPRGLAAAVGWNGSGFKLAPAVGQHTASRLLEILR